MKNLMYVAVFLISLNCVPVSASPAGDQTSDAKVTLRVKPSQVTLVAGKPQNPDGCNDPVHQQRFTATAMPAVDLEWNLEPNDPSVGRLAPIPNSKDWCYTAPPGGALMPVGTIHLVVTAGADPVRATVTLAPDNFGGGEAARLIAGFAQSAAASTSPVQKAFIDGFFSRPLPWRKRSQDAAFGPPLRIWGDLRLDSVPQQISATVGTFDIASQFGAVKVNELVQTGEFLAGVQYRLPLSTPTLRLFDLTGRGRTTVSLIAGAGMVTPLSPKDVAQIFEKPATTSSSWPFFASAYPGAVNPAYQAIAFVTQDRNRFFRQYFGGARFETHYFSDALTATARAQHSLDVMIGQNSSVTGGNLHGPVMRFEAFYAVPTGKTAPSFVYLFGTGQFAFGRSTTASPLLLKPSPACPDGCRSLYDSDVYIAALPASNRDVYRIGAGLDIVQLYQMIHSAATGTAKGSGQSSGSN